MDTSIRDAIKNLDDLVEKLIEQQNEVVQLKNETHLEV
jgi:hypothetical protein